MARTVEESHVSRKRAALARMSACTCPTILGGYFNQFPMQQLSALLQIPRGSDCPHESLFKIGLNSNTRQWSLATKDSHYYLVWILMMFGESCANIWLLLLHCVFLDCSDDGLSESDVETFSTEIFGSEKKNIEKVPSGKICCLTFCCNLDVWRKRKNCFLWSSVFPLFSYLTK